MQPPGFIPYNKVDPARLKACANGDLSSLNGQVIKARVVSVSHVSVVSGVTCTGRPALIVRPSICLGTCPCAPVRRWVHMAPARPKPRWIGSRPSCSTANGLTPALHPTQVDVARRELILSERLVAAATALSQLKPGDEVEGVVTGVEDYGAFVQVRPQTQGAYRKRDRRALNNGMRRNGGRGDRYGGLRGVCAGGRSLGQNSRHGCVHAAHV